MRDRGRIRLDLALIALGAMLLATYLWAAGDGCVAQGELAGRLKSLLTRNHEGVAGGVALATRREAQGSGLVGRIEIRRLHYSAMILEGTSSRALRRGVGHVEHTAFPGEAGNVALAGHRDTYFRRLAHIAEGDTIRLRTPDGSFTYRVSSTLVVGPERADLLRPTPSPTLTLVTCFPFHWIGPAPDRFVVRAASVAQPGPAPGEPRPRAVARRAGGHAGVTPAVTAGT